MKKLFLTLSFVILTVLYPAVPVFAEGPYISFDLGSYSRRIQETNPGFAGSPVFYATADSTRLTAKIGANLGGLDVYLIAGGATLSIPDFDGYAGKMGPLFGAGLKLALFESPTYEHFRLFFNPEAIVFSTSDVIFTYTGGGPVLEQHDIQWSEYTFKFGGSARYYEWEPYGGVKVSFVNGEETAPAFGTGDISEVDNIGLFFGANFYLDRRGKTLLYGELGGGDSDYFTVGLRSRF